MIIAGIVFVVFVLLSAFFSGSETGLYSISKVRVNVGAEEGLREYKPLATLLTEPEKLIFTILMGNNIATFAVSWAGTCLLAGFGDNAELINTFIAAPVLFLFGEVTPKTLYYLRPEALMLKTSRPLLILHRFFTLTGVCHLLSKISLLFEKRMGIERNSEYYLLHSRIARIFDASIEEGMLSSTQRSIIGRTSLLRKTTLSQVMVPLNKVVSARIDATRSELLALLRQHPYTRLPVTDGNTFVGRINLLKVLSSPDAEPVLAKYIKPLAEYRYDEPVIRVLYNMQKNDRQMALVSKRGHIIGLVTIKDLAEELTGELAVF
jgi:putative hemolysin